MRYVLSKLILYKEDEIYRIYVTDGLKVIGGLDKRYADITRRKPGSIEKEETRTSEEIIENIRRKLS